MKKTGIIILFIGLFITFYTGFTALMKEKNANSEEYEIIEGNRNAVNWQPYVGIGIMIIGGLVFVLGENRKDGKEIIKM
jgi:uncharacterized membrane protein